jgi:hypothetical protein
MFSRYRGPMAMKWTGSFECQPDGSTTNRLAALAVTPSVTTYARLLPLWAVHVTVGALAKEGLNVTT